ncbi:MAG TPA: hypothetical protein VND90_07185 [Terracidiphilus sp.]|nr:hypothetical protein [Terracidiphilus sp.]
MEIRGPEDFYFVQMADVCGFYPTIDLGADENWPELKCLEFAMGWRPVSVERVFGYGAYLEHEDFWIFGRTPEEVEIVAAEWPAEG